MQHRGLTFLGKNLKFRLEHGHLYDLFNSPAFPPEASLGYCISRNIASSYLTPASEPGFMKKLVGEWSAALRPSADFATQAVNNLRAAIDSIKPAKNDVAFVLQPNKSVTWVRSDSFAG